MPNPSRLPLTAAAFAVAALAVAGWFWLVDAETAGSDGEVTTIASDAPGAEAKRPGPATESSVRRVVAASGATAGPRELVGRVLDHDGRPLARAMVGDITAARPVATNAQGGFVLPIEPGRESVRLLVLARDHAPAVVTHDLDPQLGEHDLGDVRLSVGGRIRGRVLDERGTGLPDVTMTLLPVPGNSWPRELELSEVIAPAHTGPAGEYELAALMAGAYRLTAAAPGRQVVVGTQTLRVQSGGVTEADPMTLPVGFELSGKVVDTRGRALEGVEIRVRNGAGQPRFRETVRSDASGRFQLLAVPPGPALRVEASKPGYLRFQRSDVDAATDEELVITLATGLRITGTVVDAASKRPVERFATSIRRIGNIDPPTRGTIDQQLERAIGELRAISAAGGKPDELRANQKLADELAARLDRLTRQRETRAAAVPSELGPAEHHPQGEFEFPGLEAGIYRVWVLSPDHHVAVVEPIELRAGAAEHDVRVELRPGTTVRGTVVTKAAGKPVAGANVSLVREVPISRERQAGHRSLYPWAFAKPGAQGVALMTTTTDAGGRFELAHAPPGRCYLSVRHATIADHDTAVFDSRAAGTLRVLVGGRASLSGHVRGVSRDRVGQVEVFVLGGHGTMRSVRANADLSYRIDGLQPGSYLVRAFPSGSRRPIDRLFASIFPLHAGAVDPDKVPKRDVTLAESEHRSFDLQLDLPPVGVVRGVLSINGQPGRGGRAVLRPVPGEAPASGGLSLSAYCDDAGRFEIADVPVGNYVLRLYGKARHEVHAEPLTVVAGGPKRVQVDVSAGGLRGTVTSVEAVAASELRGLVWVLPGAKEPPTNVYEYRRSHRTHRIRVRDGVFESQGLTPGPALLLVEIRGSKPAVVETVIPTAGTGQVDVVIGR